MASGRGRASGVEKLLSFAHRNLLFLLDNRLASIATRRIFVLRRDTISLSLPPDAPTLAVSNIVSWPMIPNRARNP
jgi:hypothetical protein